MLAALLAADIADYSGVTGSAALDDAARPLIVAVVLFGLAGYPLVRFFLPDALRGHEPLWIVPVGACALALTMTVLGFARVPYALNLGLVTAAAIGGSVLAYRRRGLPQRPASLRAIGWPVYLAVLLVAVALIPLFRSGFATVVGQGQDAHMAAGTAEFLKHAAPNEVRPELPIDQQWPTWRSKQAIYYATAAVSTYTRMETYEVLSAIASLMFALAAIGMFLVAREMLGAGIGLAALAMTLAALDRMVLHTAMHPYYNQIWGYMTMPFGLILAWRLVRAPSIPTAGLLLLIVAIEFFAYPLAAPIVVTALAVFWWVDRRARRRAGEQVRDLDPRRLWPIVKRQRRPAQVAIAVVAFLLLVPLWGAFEKLTGATQLLINPHYDLSTWGGDLQSWFAEPLFFAIPDEPLWPVALVLVVGLGLWQLTRLPRAMAWGIFSLLVAGAFVVGTMRARDHGWYFHFKMLAFLGPLIVVLGAVALRQVRYVGMVGLVIWTIWALQGAKLETASTFDELPRTTLELRGWAASLPAGASVRLDVQAESQPWPAYMMASRRLCSQRPLDDTAYPHVQVSRAADYVLVWQRRKPFDAIGPPLRQNGEYALYRLRPGLPGGDRCSQRMIQTVTEIRRG